MNSFAIADPFLLEHELGDGERAVRDAVAKVVDDALLPIIADAFEAGRFPDELVGELARTGILGGSIAGHGCAGLGAVAYGLAMMELERGDSGVRSFASVQGALVMWPIATYGSDEQKARWLPAMARGEQIGCFGLTEPQSGSDPGSMQTFARKDGDDWLLFGEKRWLTNGPFANVALVWAKLEGEGPESIRGFLVELPSAGAEMVSIPRRMSLRASASGQLKLSGVRVPAASMLPGVKGLKGPLSCLNQARHGIAWGATGAHAACLEAARDYTKARQQFGKPLASKQLVQERLAEIYTALGHAQLVAMRLGRLKEAGKLTPAQVSFVKRAKVASALESAR
jgi:glutaryl-CoA dehydrogenase